jgi:hypothetical protein
MTGEADAFLTLALAALLIDENNDVQPVTEDERRQLEEIIERLKADQQHSEDDLQTIYEIQGRSTARALTAIPEETLAEIITRHCGQHGQRPDLDEILIAGWEGADHHAVHAAAQEGPPSAEVPPHRRTTARRQPTAQGQAGDPGSSEEGRMKRLRRLLWRLHYVQVVVGDDTFAVTRLWRGPCILALPGQRPSPDAFLAARRKGG